MTVFRYVGATTVFALAAPAAAAATEPACVGHDHLRRPPAAPPPPPPPPPPADLARCPGDGLVIGANGITVDLSRHTVAGTGAGAGLRLAGRRGVEDPGRHRHRLRARDRRARRRHRELGVEGVEVIRQPHGDRVHRVRRQHRGSIPLSANAVTGVLVFGSTSTRVLANRVADNAGNGIAVVGAIEDCYVSANDIRGAVRWAVDQHVDRNTSHPRRRERGDGVQVAGDGNVLAGNLVDGSVGGCEVAVTGYGARRALRHRQHPEGQRRHALRGRRWIAVAAPGTAFSGFQRLALQERGAGDQRRRRCARTWRQPRVGRRERRGPAGSGARRRGLPGARLSPNASAISS